MKHFTDELANRFFSKLGVLTKQFPRHAHEGFKPFITISREAGSGGRPIAEMVAKQLKFELYDEKFVEEIAKSAKKRTELVKSIDEKARGLVTDMLQSVLNPEYISDMTYIRHATKVVLTRAHSGSVVFLDRGANFMVPSAAALRVRIQAPYAVRVARAIKYENIDVDQAKDIIRQADTERKEFVRQYFNKSISNANYYDIVLNTTHMTMEDVRDLIVFAFKKKFRIK